MTKRPIVVVTGQGLSLADGFNLTEKLRTAVPEDKRDKFPGLYNEGTSLDDVFSATRRQEPDGMEHVSDLARITRSVCVAARQIDDHKRHHRAVLSALKNASTERLVLHLTANIDGIATRVAVQEFGGVWRPLERAGDEVMIEDVKEDARRLVGAGRGLLHIPVHGEAGLAAVAGQVEWEGAKRLQQCDDINVTNQAYSTLAQGMGVQVAEIERLMEASGLGYRLLSALLTSTPSNDDGVGNELPPAHLLVIGYGAGNTHKRIHYAFERRVREISARDFPIDGAVWRAVVFHRHPPSGEVTWLTRHKVDVIHHGPDDLGDVAKQAIQSLS